MKAFLLTVFVLLTACARPDYLTESDLTPVAKTHTLPRQHLYFSMEWSQGPRTPEVSEFILRFWPENTTPTDSSLVDPQGDLNVILWMPSMGHGSVPVKVERLSAGVYRVSNVYFIMPGDWEVQVYIKNGNQVLDQNFVSLIL